MDSCDNATGLFCRLFADYDLTGWHALPTKRLAELLNLPEQAIIRHISILVRVGLLEQWNPPKQPGPPKKTVELYRVAGRWLIGREEWLEQVGRVEEERERTAV
jgi:hypothetical protein